MKQYLKPASQEDLQQRQLVLRRCRELVQQNICPTCQQFASGDVFPGTGDREYLHDDRLIALLEQYPRGVGHTIVITKEHYSDLSELPLDLAHHMTGVMLTLVSALKRVTGAQKVYQVTMCSGEVSHLHYQLIPRLRDDVIGGRTFSLPRSVLINGEDLRRRLQADLAYRHD